MRRNDIKELRKIQIKAIPEIDWNNLQSIPEEKAVEIFGKKFSQDNLQKFWGDQSIQDHRVSYGNIISF